MDKADTKILKIIAILFADTTIPTAAKVFIYLKVQPWGDVFTYFGSDYFILTTACIISLVASSLWIKDVLDRKIFYSIATAVLVIPVYIYTLIILSLIHRL